MILKLEALKNTKASSCIKKKKVDYICFLIWFTLQYSPHSTCAAVDGDYCKDVCEFNFLMVCAIFSGGARVHWLILFNSFLAKQLNIACSINTKLLCPWVPVCSAKTTYVSDSANFVAAKIIAALWFFADNSLLHADCKRNSCNFTQNCAKF